MREEPMDRLLKPRVLKENGVLYFKGTGKNE